jgi:hypothetical protein
VGGEGAVGVRAVIKVRAIVIDKSGLTGDVLSSVQLLALVTVDRVSVGACHLFQYTNLESICY